MMGVKTALSKVHNDGSPNFFCTEEREVRDHQSKEDQSYGDWKPVLERMGQEGLYNLVMF